MVLKKYFMVGKDDHTRDCQGRIDWLLRDKGRDAGERVRKDRWV